MLRQNLTLVKEEKLIPGQDLTWGFCRFMNYLCFSIDSGSSGGTQDQCLLCHSPNVNLKLHL